MPVEFGPFEGELSFPETANLPQDDQRRFLVVHNQTTQLTGIKEGNVNLSETTHASNWNFTMTDPNGLVQPTLDVGDEIEIFCHWEEVLTSQHKVIGGYIDSVQLVDQKRKVLQITGRDYTNDLKNRRVSKEYVSTEASLIVKDLLGFFPAYTTTSVVTTTFTVSKIVFTNEDVFSAIQRVANLVNYRFYIDINKDLHFESSSLATVSSEQIMRGDNLLYLNKDDRIQEVYNYVEVNGVPQITSKTQYFNGTGAQKIFQLTDVPLSPFTSVETPVGTTKTEFTDYQANYDAGTISFNSAPASGTNNIKIVYNFKQYVVKVSFNQTSIDTYGYRPSKPIFNDTLTTEADVQEYADNFIAQNKDLKSVLSMRCKRVATVRPNQIVKVTSSIHGLNQAQYLVKTMNFTYRNGRLDAQIEAGSRLLQVGDIVGEINQRIKALETSNVQDSFGNVIPKTQSETLTLAEADSGYRTNINDSFIFGNPDNNRLGTQNESTGRNTRLGAQDGSKTLLFSY